jgi:amidase
MAGFDEYERFDALGLAELVRSGQVTSAELVEAAWTRIATRNPTLRAVVDLYAASTWHPAVDDGPFAGVPFLLKDLGVQVAGERVTNGSAFWADQVTVKDSTIVRRYRAAGLVLLGSTATAEYGLSCDTRPALHGPTVNPWNAHRMAGGSSGGAAVAVASGMVPAAHATDGGGSIRIPSSCCGLFGLKPSRGRNPIGPDVGEGWNGLSVQHVITRSVRDSAAFLDATHGPEPGDPYAAPAAGGAFLDALRGPPARLSVAFQTVDHAGLPIPTVLAAAVRRTAALLEALGHRVEEARPGFDAEALKAAMFTIVGCNAAHAVHTREAALGRPCRAGDVEPITRSWIDRCAGRSGEELVRAIGTIHATARRFGRFFERFDLLLTPTCASPVLPAGSIDMQSDDLDGYYDRLYGHNGFTAPCNCTGIPAASVPLEQDDDGMPIGLQLAAPLGHERRLLQVSAQLEQARPWAHRRPAPPPA